MDRLKKRRPKPGGQRTNQLERYVTKTRRLQKELQMYQLIFDNIYNGCEVVDKDGYITHFNKQYEKFFGLDPKDQIGKHCTEVWENSRMHIVAKTGVAEINNFQRTGEKDILVRRIPIKKNGNVIAVLGEVVFKDTSEVKRLAKQLSHLEKKVKFYQQELMNLRNVRYTFDTIIGGSDALKNLRNEASRAAATNLPVLITGESGTGKELFAHAIHHGSSRRMCPFVKINCSAIPKELVESELFGYEKGAFTGASRKGKPGKFELTRGGSVFLDEIGDLPLEEQPKLLRVLEEKEFERVGGTSLVKTDFRLIAATNKNLEDMINDGCFRRDLFYRVNVIPLYIPPLRERREDIIPLANYFMDRSTQEALFSKKELEPQAEHALLNYDWPGNVRELSNVIERALFRSEDGTIHLDDLPIYVTHDRKTAAESTTMPLRNVCSTVEEDTLRHALESANHNKVKAARLLGIHRSSLYKKMRKYGIEPGP